MGPPPGKVHVVGEPKWSTLEYVWDRFAVAECHKSTAGVRARVGLIS